MAKRRRPVFNETTVDIAVACACGMKLTISERPNPSIGETPDPSDMFDLARTLWNVHAASCRAAPTGNPTEDDQ